MTRTVTWRTNSSRSPRLPAQPDRILAALLARPGFLPQDGSVVSNAPQQSQDAILIYHGLPAPASDAGRELPVRVRDTRQLVKVNLPGPRLPPDPADGIIIKEPPAACRPANSSGAWSRTRRSAPGGIESRTRRRLAAKVRRDVEALRRDHARRSRTSAPDARHAHQGRRLPIVDLRTREAWQWATSGFGHPGA